MLDLLLSLIGRLIDLEKYRNERLLRIVKEILQPVYEDLLKVHTNYIGMFSDVAAKLPGEATPPESRATAVAEAANELRRKRLEFEPVRRQTEAFAKKIFGGRFGKQREFKTPEADAFLRSVVDYLFPAGYLTTASAESRATTLYGAIRAGGKEIRAQDVAAPGQDRLLSELMEATIRDTQERWQRVSDAYAELKLKVHTDV
jgi:hypothetical protein